MSTATLCRLHITGVPPRTGPFYVPGCPACESKLRAGLVTHETPPPPDKSRESANRLNRSCFVAARIRKRSSTRVWGA